MSEGRSDNERREISKYWKSTRKRSDQDTTVFGADGTPLPKLSSNLTDDQGKRDDETWIEYVTRLALPKKNSKVPGSTRTNR